MQAECKKHFGTFDVAVGCPYCPRLSGERLSDEIDHNLYSKRAWVDILRDDIGFGNDHVLLLAHIVVDNSVKHKEEVLTIDDKPCIVVTLYSTKNIDRRFTTNVICEDFNNYDTLKMGICKVLVEQLLNFDRSPRGKRLLK